MSCRRAGTQITNYPFEVLNSGNPVSVMPADQLKSLDWRFRKAVRKGVVSPDELAVA
ncbi:MAG TPA: hypothetical protein VJM12_10255 [Pyrinomonadaceae bacterium]|nr:hypothetical protein [Pyrinomonadaceae bacterium]